MVGPSPGELLREAKVSEDDVAVGCDKDIFRLEVTINDAGGMQPLDTFNNFGSIEARSVATKTTPAR